MDREIRHWGERGRTAIVVSRHDHCLVDLLCLWRRGEPDGDVVAISNHEDLRHEAEPAGVPYHRVAVEQDRKPMLGRRRSSRRAGPTWWCSHAIS
jgi:formyltetrahydrofolate deformylase